MEGQLFKSKYLPKNEADLAEYILIHYPETRENVAEFEVKWMDHLMDHPLSKEEQRQIKTFSIISGNRRRQEIQQRYFKPSTLEQKRRTYLARGEYLQKTAV